MKRIILFLPLLLLMYVNIQAGNNNGRGSLALVADFTASVTNGCVALTTQFTSTSTSDVGDPIVSYTWNFGDGSPLGTTASPTHTYTAQGFYTVSLTVRSQSGAVTTETKSDFIYAGNKPVFDLGADYEICEDGSQINLQTVTGPYVYTWSEPAITTWQAFLTPTSGVNIYWANVDNNGCSTSDTIRVTAAPEFDPKWDYTVLSNCGNVVVQFNDKTTMCDPGNSLVAVYWEIDGAPYLESNPTHTFSAGGTYTIYYYVEDQNGNSHDETVTITIPNPSPGPSPVNLGGNKTICAGGSVQLDAGSEPGATYVWTPATGLSSTSVYNPVASPASTQTYTVTKTKCGVDETGTVTVNVNPPFTVNLGADQNFCAGFVSLDAGVSGAIYQWGCDNDPFFSLETTQVVGITHAGTYWVTVIKNGCSASDTIVFRPSAPATANFTYTKTGDGTCGPFTVSVTDISTSCSGAINNREWNFGDGTIVSGTSGTVNHTYSAAGSYTVTLIVTTSLGGKDTTAQTVTYTGSSFTVDLGNDTTICSGNSVTLDAGPGTTYSWSTGANTRTITVSPTVSTNYSVTVINALGCTGSDAKMVNIGSGFTVDLGNDTTICSGNSVTLDAGPGTTYSWSTGANTRTITVSPTVSTNYSVTVINASGCTGSDAKMVNIGSGFTVDLGNDTTICSGNSVTLDAGPGTTYSWSTGANTRTITVSPTVSTNYSVTVINASGCTGSDSKMVNLAPPFTVNLGADQDFCAGFVLLDAGVSGAIYQWGCDNDPFFSLETTQVVGITHAGTYWVTVIKNGCSVSDTIVFRPSAPATANFTYTKTGDGTCGPFTVSVTDISTSCSGAINNREWNFGDGTIVSGTSGTANHTYSMAGSYTVTLIVTTSLGVKDTATQSISFTGSGIAVNLGNDTTICSGNSLTLDAGNSGSTYTWINVGTGVIIGSGQTISVTESGNYSVEVNNGLCKATDAIQVTVSNNLNINLGNDTTICPLNSVTLDAGNYPGATYLWSSNVNGPVNNQTVTVSPDDPANVYTVTVTQGGCSGTGTITVFVNPALPVNLGNDTAICAGSIITFDAGYPGATYLWSDGQSSRTITTNQPGTYKVNVTYNGCSGADEIQLSVIDPPAPVNLGNDINICFGNNVVLDAGEYNAVEYLWSTGETTRTITATQSGNYSVTVSGCGAPVSDTISVTMGNLAAPVITQIGIELICTQADSYQWYKDGVLIPGATNQKYKPRGYGNYTVVVTNTALGCTGKTADYWFVPNGDYYLGDIRVKITPNPSAGQTKLVLSKLPGKPIKVTIYDRIGRRLINREIINLVNEINMTAYAKGLYFVECVLDNKRVILPLVTQ